MLIGLYLGHYMTKNTTVTNYTHVENYYNTEESEDDDTEEEKGEETKEENEKEDEKEDKKEDVDDSITIGKHRTINVTL
jgi:hypothetical protein